MTYQEIKKELIDFSDEILLKCVTKEDYIYLENKLAAFIKDSNVSRKQYDEVFIRTGAGEVLHMCLGRNTNFKFCENT